MAAKKILIVYYSRTGTTRKLVEVMKEELRGDVEEIIDTKNRKGLVGYIQAGRDAMKKYLTKIEKPSKNPADYDLVIIGTPIWSWNVSTPVRTYLSELKGSFKQVAFFCTMGGSGAEGAFSSMKELIGVDPIATLSLTNIEILKNKDLKSLEKLNKFIANLIN